MKKKILSILLAMVLTLSLSTVAIANDTAEAFDTAANSSVDTVLESETEDADIGAAEEYAIASDDVVLLDGGTLDVEDLFDYFVPSGEEGMKLPDVNRATRNARMPAININDVSESITEGVERADAASSRARANYGYDLYTYTGTLSNTSDAAFAYPLYVYPGETLQVRLDHPTGVDYDLYLYAFDSNGNINPNPVDLSIHANASSVLPEAVGVVNNTGATISYAVEVYSKSGGSTTPFTLYVSYSDEPDAHESDQNAWKSNTTELAGMGLAARTTVTRTLNSPIDEDWFEITIPNITEMNGIELTTTTPGVKIELFRASIVSGSVVFTPVTNNGSGIFDALSGTTYMRVSPNSLNTVGNYQVRVAPVAKVATATFRVLQNGSVWPLEAFSIPGTTRRNLIQGRTVTLELTLRTASGAAAANAVHPAYWEVVNSAWSSSAPSHYTAFYANRANANGILNVTGTAPIVFGQGTGVNIYWDWSVNFSGVSGTTVVANELIYLSTR